jgi:PBP1b-binding outer membrane lipoprotein LpoB
MTKTWRMVVLAFLLLSIPGCGGGLRYSQVAPEAKDFHPRRVAALPADTTAFPEAKGVIDRLFAEALSEQKWFTAVVGGEEIGRRLKTDTELRQVTEDYLAKREKVSYSDSALSGRIGVLTDAEALLFVRVDYWNYTTENDKKVGKVNLSIEMIEAQTGKILWTAVHQRISDYMIIKPELHDMAKGLIREMIGYMPH